MKNKTILPLLAAGVIGCIGRPVRSPYIDVPEVYSQTDNEERLLSSQYEKNVNNLVMKCLRTHYVERMAGTLKSFLAVEHCLNMPEARDGRF